MNDKVIYKLSDDVIARIVQILQEAILTGVDCTDIFRQIELEQDVDDATYLVLPEAYVQRVAEGYARMVDQVEGLRGIVEPEEFKLNIDG
jgi:hypothetical protein